MSALCCAAPSLNLMSTGTTGSSLPVYHHHFSRPMAPHHQSYSFMPMELNVHHGPYGSSRMQQQLPCHPDQFASYNNSQQHQQQQQQMQQQQQQQFLMPQQQQQQAVSRSRRKRLEDALTEAIPAASSGKVSQRIAQLQQSLYASCHPVASAGRIHPLTSSSRPLSLDPTKDYSLPLTVDCSIEYDLPRVARPPPGAKPLLLIARRPPPPPTLPAVRESPTTRQRQQQHWNCSTTSISSSSNPVPPTHQISSQQQQQQFIRPTDCGGGYFVMNVAPVSSSSSEDSGRGTDSERASSPVPSNRTVNHNPNNWMMNASVEQSTNHHHWIRTQLKLNNHVKPGLSALPQHPRPAEAARAHRGSDQQQQQPGCHCCPSRSSQIPQRWAPYNTTMARHGCPAPAALQQQQLQQQQHVESWTRWTNDSSALDHLLSHSSSSSSLMAFHI